MPGLFTICPECHKPEVTYSTGLIPCAFGIGYDYPVLRCGHCRQDFLLRPPYREDSWQRCSVNSFIAFTKDPDAIDKNIRLKASLDPRPGKGWYVNPWSAEVEFY